MSTGWTGTIVSIDDRIEVRFPNYRRGTLKFSPASLKALPMPKKKVLSFIHDREQVLRVVYKHNAKYLSRMVRFDSFDLERDVVKFSHGIEVARKDLLVAVPNGAAVKFERPEVDGFPFWMFGDTQEVAITGFDNQLGVLNCTGNIMMSPEWVNKDIRTTGFGYVEVKEPVAKPDNNDEVVNDYVKLLAAKFPDGAMKLAGMSFSMFYYDEFNKPRIYLQKGAACHYAMKTVEGDLRDKRKCSFEFGVQYITRHYHGADKVYKKQTEKYLEWVMNDSPWSRYILTKSFDEALATGIRIKLDIPSNAMMCTFYALRYPTEYSDKIVTWNKWVDAGMNGAGAFFMSETKDLESDTASHHQLLNTKSMDLDSVVNFIKHGVGEVVTDIYTKTLRYSDVSIHHGKRNLKGETGLQAIRKLDIFKEGEVEAGGPFNRRMVKAIDGKKVVAIMNKFAE